MELRQQNTFVTSLLDKGLKHRDLIRKIFLFAEKPCHATLLIFPRADWRAFCMHACNVEASGSFFESLLQAFLLTFVSCHFLNLAVKFGVQVTGWDNSSLAPHIWTLVIKFGARTS